MLCMDRARYTTRTTAYLQRQEFSVDVKMHGVTATEAPKALATAVNACLKNALDGRELAGGTVDIQMHVKDQEDKLVSFTERPMCAAEQAVRVMDKEVAGWKDTLPRRGSIEIFVGAILKNVMDKDPSAWWLEQRKTHLQVKREREIVDRQGFAAGELRAFDFRKFRSGQILLNPAAATKFAVQNKIVRGMARVVPYPMAGPSKEPKKEVVDAEFDALEKQAINF